MLPTLSLRDTLLKSIVQYGETNPDIRAFVLVGSGARMDQPADQWSDIDLILITAHPERFLQSSDWLNAISEPWIVTVERDDSQNLVEKRVLFRSGVDVDFIVLASTRLDGLQQEPLSSIVRRGTRVLFDKDGLLPHFPGDDRPGEPFRSPTSTEFSELVNDFWFHVVWTTKKIKRGELWTAKSCLDVYMKRLLLTLLEWQAGWNQETWYLGRFIEQWAPPEVAARFGEIFAHYNETDMWKALFKTLQLFDDVARMTAKRLDLPYLETRAEEVQAWVRMTSSRRI